MKKTTVYLLGIATVLLICIIAYFKPLSLLNDMSENGQISMILNEYIFRNGVPDIDVTEYEDITAEQKCSLLSLLEEYTYRRTFGTLFSSGYMTGTGNQMLYIYVFGDNSGLDSILVTSSEKIVVNGKNYRMENAEQFIEEIIDILEQTN